MDIPQYAEKFCDKIKELLGNEYVKDAQELATLEPHIDIFSRIVNLVSKASNDLKLNNAWRCISRGLNEEKSINELYNYVSSSSSRAFYISDSFKKIILSNSVISSAVLAYIVGEVVKGNRDFTQEDVILYDTLSHMTDFDIKNFVDMVDNYVGWEGIGDNYINVPNISPNIKEAYKLTLKLCTNSRLINLETMVLTEGCMNSGEFYRCTPLSDRLREYISKTKQLLNYSIS